MRGFRTTLSGMLALLLLQACAADAPPCRIAAGKAHVAEGNAGCLIERDKQMLVVRHLSAKLGMPAGFGEPGESAQCTAHRETWEEAGVAVQVGELLWEDPKNNFFLFECFLADDRSESAGLDAAEVTAVLWLDPHGIEPSQWRFPDQWPYVLEAFERRSASNAR